MNSSLVGIDSLKSWKYIHTSYEIEFLFSYNFFLSCSVTQSLLTLFNPMDCSTPGFPVLHYLLEFAQSNMSTESMMPSNHLILCYPLFPPVLDLAQSFPMSQFFTSGGQSIGASTSASVLPMNIQG